MVGVRIRVVPVMVVVTVVVMIVAVVVVVMMVVVVMAAVAMGVVVRVRVIARADSLDVMMMALLRQAHLRLEAEDLLAVLAQLAVHVVLAAENLGSPCR